MECRVRAPFVEASCLFSFPFSLHAEDFSATITVTIYTMSFGTDPEAIRAHKAISETGGGPYSPPGNVALTFSIHSLWKQSNFRKENRIDGILPLLHDPQRFDDPQGIISNVIYERMKPALRLASLFLEISEAFFVKIYRADVVLEQGTPLLDEDFIDDDDDVQAYRAMLVSHSNTVRIYTGYIQDSRIRNACGKSSSFPNERMPVYQQLNPDYIDWYNRGDYDGQDIQKKNMIAFSMATTLVHEHAHAVWQTRNHAKFTAELDNPRGELSLAEAVARARQREPYHSREDSQSELGLSWERYWFGGLLPHFNCMLGPYSVAAATGTCWTTWNTLYEVTEPAKWVVAVRTYNQFFDKDSWLAWTASQAKIAEGNERRQVSGEEFQGQLAVYLTSIKAVRSWPVYSVPYHEHFNERLNAIAQGADLDGL